MLDQQAADEGSGHARHGKRRRHDALDTTKLATRNDVGHDDPRQHPEAASADPLNGAKENQLRDGMGEARQRRSAQEYEERQQEKVFAPHEVGQFSENR